MTQVPDFDPFELLGVDATADAATIDRAYKARIRYVHPDIAGVAGLDETKRLNVAREWLLDPELRARLPRPARGFGARRAGERPGHASPPRPESAAREESAARQAHRRDAGPPHRPDAGPPHRPNADQPQGWENRPRQRARPDWDYDPLDDDPLTFDYGPRTDQLRDFFGAIRGLSADEHARVTYSLGDEPPLFFDEFKDQLSDALWGRSRALSDAITRVWAERAAEDTPLLFPTGRVFGNGAVVANAYVQWMLLGEAIRQRSPDPATVARLAARCEAPWAAAVGHPRYGSHQVEVRAFLRDARGLSVTEAERLSRSWQGRMGSYLYGRPGEDWFPGALDHPDPSLVSARVAAVDASRIEPPDGLPYQHHNGFRYGLRLTAHTIALGGVTTPGRDYLRPWRDALDPVPSFEDRARWGMPLG